MDKHMSATEARVHFGELLKAVAEDGVRVIVERGGRPAAVVISTEEYDRLTRTKQADWWDIVIDTQALFAEARERGTLPDWGELIQEEREKRDAQLLEGVLRHERRAAVVDERTASPVG